jgi:hypothetical protein
LLQADSAAPIRESAAYLRVVTGCSDSRQRIGGRTMQRGIARGGSIMQRDIECHAFPFAESCMTKRSITHVAIIAALALPFAAPSFGAYRYGMQAITPSSMQSFMADSDTYTWQNGVLVHTPKFTPAPGTGRTMANITPSSLQSITADTDSYTIHQGVATLTPAPGLPPRVAQAERYETYTPPRATEPAGTQYEAMPGQTQAIPGQYQTMPGQRAWAAPILREPEPSALPEVDGPDSLKGD